MTEPGYRSILTTREEEHVLDERREPGRSSATAMQHRPQTLTCAKVQGA